MVQREDDFQMQSRDTSTQAEAVQIELWRRMSPAQKASQLSQLCLCVQQLALAGLRSRYPEANEQELFLRLAATRLDRETMVRVYGWDPEREG